MSFDLTPYKEHLSWMKSNTDRINRLIDGYNKYMEEKEAKDVRTDASPRGSSAGTE